MKTNTAETKIIKVRDYRDGSIFLFDNESDAINACIHDWNLEIVE